MVLPGESQEDFDRFLAGFVAEYEPQTSTEAFLVQNMVGWMWKMLRLERLEAAAQVAQLSEPIRPHELARHGLDVPDGAEYYLEDITRIDALDGELYELAEPMAGLLLKQFRVDEGALSLTQVECPAFFRMLQDVAVDAGLSDLTPSGMALATVRGPGIDRVQWVRGALEGLIDEARIALWAIANRDAIVRLRGAVNDARLQSMQHYVQPKLAFDHVSRSLYRAIDELRKHQSWRKRVQVIDVMPSADVDKG